MATEKQILTKTWIAGEDLRLRQYRAVRLDGDEIKRATLTTQRAVGILQDAPALGEDGLVAMLGISKAVVNGDSPNVAVGDPLTYEGNGELKKAVYENCYVARALEPVEADGVVARVFLMPLRKKFEEDSTQLATPGTLTNSGITESGFTAGWASVPNADSYTVQLFSDAGYTTQVGSTETTSSTSQAFTGLDPSTTYYWRVKATATSSKFTNSAWATSSVNTALAEPDNLENESIATEGFTAKWSTVSDADGYTIEVHDNDGYTNAVQTETTASLEQAFTGLSAGTQYWWRVKATDSGTDYADSAWAEETVYLKLADPTSLDEENVEATSFKAVWSEVTGADEYEVELHDSDQYDSQVGSTVTTSSTEATFDTLDPSTQYYWRVKATSENHVDSDWADESVITALAAPTGLVVTGTTTDSATVEWSAVDNATHYDAEIYARDDVGGVVVAYIADATDPNGTFSELTLGTEYSWRVMATADGYPDSEWSEPHDVTTDAS